MAEIVPLNLLYERFPAKTKRFNETIVFVHHYDGNKHSFRRHIDWLNEAGFDCVTFDLPMKSVRDFNRIPFDKDWNFGFRFVWADAIERVLGSMAELKIVYSFSFPSISALMAMDRRHVIDVKGWICDGGPFRDVVLNFEKLARVEKLFQAQPSFEKYPKLAKFLARTATYLVGAHNYDAASEAMLARLPKKFPVLSIRAEKDELVPPQSIEKFFKSAIGHIDLHILNLPQSGHLGGFKNEPIIYQRAVQKFLLDVATPVISDDSRVQLDP